jgi:hypothetical protein
MISLKYAIVHLHYDMAEGKRRLYQQKAASLGVGSGERIGVKRGQAAYHRLK